MRHLILIWLLILTTQEVVVADETFKKRLDSLKYIAAEVTRNINNNGEDRHCINCGISFGGYSGTQHICYACLAGMDNRDSNE